jgi:hypothetical protein
LQINQPLSKEKRRRKEGEKKEKRRRKEGKRMRRRKVGSRSGDMNEVQTTEVKPVGGKGVVFSTPHM